MPQLNRRTTVAPNRVGAQPDGIGISAPEASINPTHVLQWRIAASFGRFTADEGITAVSPLPDQVERALQIFSRVAGVVLFVVALAAVLALLF